MAVSSLKHELLAVGLEAGLDRVGVCSAEPFPGVQDSLIERSRSGMSGGLGFTFSRPEQAGDVRRTFPWAAALIAGVKAYLPAAGDPGRRRSGTGRVARFATEDHYLPLRQALNRVADHLRESGHRGEVMVDDSRLVDRAVAVRAGIGWWGKNTMVLTPALGPWFLIGSVVTDAELEPDAPAKRDCGSCEACLPACPTGALVAPGVLDARRCLAAVLQQKGPIPRSLRRAVGDRIYGCDDCLEACPPGTRLVERSARVNGRHEVGDLLALEDDALVARFAHFYVPGRKARYLRRNLLVVAGNTHGDEEAVGRFADDLDPLLRAHAAWALGQIGGPGAIEVLLLRLETEDDAEVRDEVVSALGQCGFAPIGR
jgi:epoxyqueuosine reductase